MWLFVVALWSSAASAQPGPTKRDYTWTETKLGAVTLSADDYRDLLTAGSPELAMRVVDRLVRDARSGNRDALRATLEIANGKDLSAAIIAANALMTDPKAFDLRPWQLDDVYKNILDKKPDHRTEAWRKYTLDELAAVRALTKLTPYRAADYLLLLDAYAPTIGKDAPSASANLAVDALRKAVERGDSEAVAAIREVVRKGDPRQVTAAAGLMMQAPERFTDEDWKAVRDGLAYDSKRVPSLDIPAIAKGAQRETLEAYRWMLERNGGRTPVVNDPRMREYLDRATPEERAKILAVFAKMRPTIPFQASSSIDAIARDPKILEGGRVQVDSLALPTRIVYADGSEQWLTYGYRSDSFTAPEVNWLVTRSKDGKVVYMVRRTSNGTGKLDDWGVGSTVEEARKGDTIWKGNVSPTDGGIRVEDPLETRKVQPNLQTEVKDKLFGVTRVEDASGTIKTMTADRGSPTKFEYKDGALDKIHFPNGTVISKTKDGWSMPGGPNGAWTAKDIYVGKGGIIVKTSDKDGEWMGYFGYDGRPDQNRWMMISPEKKAFLEKLRDSMVKAGSIPEGTPVELVWELADRAHGLRIGGMLEVQSKLVNLTVAVNRQGPVISNDELIAIRNRLEELRLKLREIEDARKAGDLEKVASLTKHYQPILEEGFKQSFEDIKKYVKDGPGFGEVLGEAWWGFQLKFLHTFDWICDNPFKAAGLLALTIVAPEVMLGVMLGSMAVETGKGIGALTYGYMNNDWAHIQHGAQTLGGVGFDAVTLAGPHFAVKGYGAFRNIPAVKVALSKGPKIELPNVFRPKTEPAKVEPAKVEPAKVEPAKVEPAKVEPAKVEPAKVEPAKVEPAKVEPTKEPTVIPPESSLPRTPEAQKANGGTGSDTLNLSPWYWKSFGELFHVAVALKVLPWMKVYLDGVPASVRNSKIAELKPQVEANAVELKALEGKAAEATKANKPLEAGDQVRLAALRNQTEALAELNRGLITENFLREAGLGDRITLDKPTTSMRVGEATDVLSTAYKENPALTRQVVKDWTGDGKLSEPVTKWLENAFNDAGIKPGEKVVIIWNRQQAYAADRSTSPETLIALMDAAKANGRRVVVMGDKLPPEVAAHLAKQSPGERAADLTEAWKKNPELGQYQPQLKLAKHLLDNFDAAQIGMKSGGLDGAAFMGMKTAEIVSSRGAVEVSNGSTEVPIKLGNGKEFEVDLAGLDKALAGKPKADHYKLTNEWLKAEYARQSKDAGVEPVPEMLDLMAKNSPRMSNTRMIQLEAGLPFRIIDRSAISPTNANATMRDLFSLMPKPGPKAAPRPTVFPAAPSLVAPTNQDGAQKKPPMLGRVCDPPPTAPPAPH